MELPKIEEKMMEFIDKKIEYLVVPPQAFITV